MIYYIFKIGVILARLSPFSFFYKLTLLSLNIAYYLVKKRKRTTYNNFSYFLNNLSLSFFKNSFIHWILYYIEFLVLAANKEKKLISPNLDNINLENLNYIKEALAKNKGLIIATLHLGNWDLGGVIIKKLFPQYQLKVLAERLRESNLLNFYINVRKKLGLEVIPQSPQSIKELIAALRKGDIVAILIDRRVGNIKSMRNLIKINLFAKEFYISNIANVLTRRTEAPLIFSILARENIFPPSFILSFSPPLYVEETRDIALISKIIQNYLNKYIVQWYTPWMESNIKYGFTEEKTF